MDNETKKAVDELKNSIVYQMSLGSRELFHSNLWAWMMEKEPRVISEVFFEEVTTSDAVKREDGNRDITIYIGNDVYVIENKFKSIPTEEQLNKYSVALGKKFKRGILTGVSEPYFDLPDGWSFLSYNDISARLRKIKWDSLLSGCETIISEYLDMLDSMLDIVSAECLDAKGSDSSILKLTRDDLKSEEEKKVKDKDGDYRKLRIDDLLIKLHAVAFCKYLLKNEEIKRRRGEKPDGYQLCVEPDFRNGTGIVNVFYRKGTKKEKNEYLIGVQIQNNQFRYCVAVPKKDYQSIFEDYKAYGWFEEYSKTGKKEFKEKGSSMSPRDGGSYNKYNGTSKFVYQYFDLTDLTYENIVDLLDKALGKAKAIIQQIKSK